ncbi:AAA family ATPase [Paraburkholderia sp. DHOC27]|uniref:AAA family ATPase n=1 Tax=Paraburkholderia sp. DHOC27 TaxID=2303330 RepID=UPI000E3D341C|nr:AAA family ATPase [Paraburkholderia sp. DHOC27]RFU44618.1 pilus assembly protein CpaE [Paraburkholderia sp. DHOC27]
MIDILLLSSSDERATAIGTMLANSSIGHSLRIEAGSAKQLARFSAQIKKADLLIVEDAELAVADLAAIEEAIVHTPLLTCMLVTAALSTDMLMAAMRAGVRHVLSWPIDVHEFTRELAHVASKKSANARRAGRVISFAAGKGGCGTTLIATNVAYTLAAERDKRVLFIDLTQHFADASLLLSEKTPPATLSDLCAQIDRLDTSLFEACVTRVHPNLDVLAGAGDPVKAADLRASHLQRLLTLVRDQYDAVVFDIGQNVNPLSIHVLDQSEAICVVAQQTIPHLHTTRRLLDMLTELGYPASRARVLVNQYDKRAQIGLDAVEQALGAKPSHLLPTDEKSARQSANQGMPLLAVAKSGALTKNVVALTELLWPYPEVASKGAFSRLFASRARSDSQLKPIH